MAVTIESPEATPSMRNAHLRGEHLERDMACPLCDLVDFTNARRCLMVSTWPEEQCSRRRAGTGHALGEYFCRDHAYEALMRRGEQAVTDALEQGADPVEAAHLTIRDAFYYDRDARVVAEHVARVVAEAAQRTERARRYTVTLVRLVYQPGEVELVAYNPDSASSAALSEPLDDGKIAWELPEESDTVFEYAVTEGDPADDSAAQPCGGRVVSTRAALTDAHTALRCQSCGAVHGTVKVAFHVQPGLRFDTCGRVSS